MQKDTGHMEPIDMGNPLDREMAEKSPDLVFRIGETLKVKDGDLDPRKAVFPLNRHWSDISKDPDRVYCDENTNAA